jgi:hypothetical protein
VYDAVFPPTNCGTTVEYYLSVETTNNQLVTDPQNAPNNHFETFSADNLNVILDDNFETDQGWTVQNQNVTAGAWIRGIPGQGGSRGDPPDDFDGSGRCFITGNTGNEDLDGGPTRLLSPRLDMSGNPAIVTYARWHTNDDGDDFLVVEISNDDGSNWTQVESVPNSAGWTERSFIAADFLTQTANMRLRFTSSDQPNNSVTESGIDAVRVYSIDCDGGGGYTLNVTGSCPGTITVAWSNADPNVQQGIVFGNNQGSTVIPPGNPCNGTVLGLSGNVRLVSPPGFFSTGNGSGSINGNAGDAACGHYLQLVQGSNCAKSNVAQIGN